MSSVGVRDFCVYTPKGVAVERIYPSNIWQSKNIPELKHYFSKHMLPEIIDPKLKPSYLQHATFATLPM